MLLNHRIKEIITTKGNAIRIVAIVTRVIKTKKIESTKTLFQFVRNKGIMPLGVISGTQNLLKNVVITLGIHKIHKYICHKYKKIRNLKIIKINKISFLYYYS